MKAYCESCKKPTEHRKKLRDIVCNECDACNFPVFLVRSNDGKVLVGNNVCWIEWSEDGRGKGVHPKPAVGYSLCLDPYSYDILGETTSSYQWLTTQVTELVEEIDESDFKTVKFKTKNSEYTVYITTVKI